MANQPSRKLAVILHADVTGSTALVHMDESLAHARMQAAFRRFSTAIEAYEGLTHELRGDALVAEFARASDAVSAALSFQGQNAAVLARLDDELKPELRIGISIGEVVIADNTITGAGVVLAQRVEQLAEPGGVCITGAVREAVPEHLPFEYADLGQREAKGFEQPVQVYGVAVRAGQELPAAEADPPREAWAGRPGLKLLGGAAVLLAGVIALVSWGPWGPDFKPASAERMAFPLPEKPSIAVLPFDNLGGDTEQGHLADGMTDTLITTLAQVPELFVIARNSVFTYKGKPVQVQQVAEELGIRFVLEGSIQRSGERLRVNVQLIDAASGHNLWSESYERRKGDLFELQDEIALKTAMELQVKLTGVGQSRVHGTTTKDVRAWLDYLEGRVHYQKFTNEDQLRARELYTRAVQRDPRFAEAWIGLGWVHWNEARFRRTDDSDASLRAAEEMADRAAALAPDSHALAVLRGQIYLYRNEFDRAMAQLRRAIELSPSDADAIAVLAQTLLYSGEYEESVRLTGRAMRQSPFFPSWFLLNLARAQVLMGQPERAIQTSRQGLERAEGYLMTAAHRVTMAMAHAESGDLAAARESMDKVLERFPKLTSAKYAERYRFKRQADWDRFAALLRTAGLPDGEGQ